jgi:hypothetical protein
MVVFRLVGFAFGGRVFALGTRAETDTQDHAEGDGDGALRHKGGAHFFRLER